MKKLGLEGLAREIALGQFWNKAYNATDKELEKMYKQELNKRKGNREKIFKLKKENSLISKGIKIIEKEMERRKKGNLP